MRLPYRIPLSLLQTRESQPGRFTKRGSTARSTAVLLPKRPAEIQRRSQRPITGLWVYTNVTVAICYHTSFHTPSWTRISPKSSVHQMHAAAKKTPRVKHPTCQKSNSRPHKNISQKNPKSTRRFGQQQPASDRVHYYLPVRYTRLAEENRRRRTLTIVSRQIIHSIQNVNYKIPSTTTIQTNKQTRQRQSKININSSAIHSKRQLSTTHISGLRSKSGEGCRQIPAPLGFVATHAAGNEFRR